LFIVLMFYC